jgi:hypothetical protein
LTLIAFALQASWRLKLLLLLRQLLRQDSLVSLRLPSQHLEHVKNMWWFHVHVYPSAASHLIVFVFIYHNNILHVLHLIHKIWRPLSCLVADWLLLLLLLLACLARDLPPQAAC